MAQLEQVNDMVTNFSSFVDMHLCPYLQAIVKLFTAGQIKYYFHHWQKITSDKYILQMVAGDLIEFNGPPPIDNSCPNNHISNGTISKVKMEINSLLANSGVASGYSRYSVNTLQFPEKIIICIMLRKQYYFSNAHSNGKFNSF